MSSAATFAVPASTAVSSYASLRRRASAFDDTLREQLKLLNSDELAGLLADTDSSGKTALHHAAWRGHIANVEALLDAGADVNTWSTGMYNFGKTPIFYAITRCRDEVVQLLLRRGAHTRVVNNKGQSVLSLAFSHCSDATVALVEEAEQVEDGEWLNFRETHSDGEVYGDQDPRFLERPIQPDDVVHRLSINPTTRQSRQEKVERRNAQQDAEAEAKKEEERQETKKKKKKEQPLTRSQYRALHRAEKEIPPTELDTLAEFAALAMALESPDPAVSEVARAADALVTVLRDQKTAWLPATAKRIHVLAAAGRRGGGGEEDAITTVDDGDATVGQLPDEFARLLNEAATWSAGFEGNERKEEEQRDPKGGKLACEPSLGVAENGEESAIALPDCVTDRKRVAGLRLRLLRMAASPLAILGATVATAAEVRSPPPKLFPQADGAAPGVLLELPRPFVWIDTVEGLRELRRELEGATYVGVDTEWAFKEAAVRRRSVASAPSSLESNDVSEGDASATSSARAGTDVAADVAADGTADGTADAAVDATGGEGQQQQPEQADHHVGRRSKEKLVETCRLATIQLSCDHSGATYVLDALFSHDGGGASGEAEASTALVGGLVGGAQADGAYAAAAQELMTWLVTGSDAPRLVGFAFAADAELLARWISPSAMVTAAGANAAVTRDGPGTLQAGSRLRDPASVSQLTPMTIRRRVLDVQSVAVSVGIGSVGIVPSLRVVCAAVLGTDMSKEEQVSDWGARPLRRSQLEYAALDALACVRIRERIFRECGVGE